MDEADRLRRIEAGKKLLQQRQKKKGKSKKKKVDSSVVVDISTDMEASLVQDQSVISDSIALPNETGCEDGTDDTGKEEILINIKSTGFSDPPNFNDELEPHVSVKNPSLSVLDNWEHSSSATTTTTNSLQIEPMLSMDDQLTNPDIDLNFPDGLPQGLSNSIPVKFSMENQGNLELQQRLRDSQDAVAQLKNEIINLRNEKEQVVNELNSLRESQFDVMERMKRELSSSSDLKLANLQQSLVEKEHQLQNIEQQLIEAKRFYEEQDEKHRQELGERDQRHAQILSEHEKQHSLMIDERDKKHAEQIARISSELNNQHYSGPLSGAEKDSDEQEAERLKMIKEKMKEMHDKEKTEIFSEHSREKERLQADFQKQFEEYRVQAENAANSQIKSMYDQFVEAHKTVEDQKKSLENEVQRLADELGEARALNENFEKQMSAQQSTVESYSAQLENERKSLSIIRAELRDWTEKAAKLEEQCISQETKLKGQAEEEKEKDKTISEMRLDYETKIGSLQSMIEQHQTQMQQVKVHYQSELSEARALADNLMREKSVVEGQYQSLANAHTAELERERRNSSTLEMKLKDWTEKASKLESKLASSESQTSSEIQREKDKTISRMSSDYERKISSLQSEIDKYQTQLQEVESRHQRELNQALSQIREEHQASLQEAEELNQRRIEEIVSKHEDELDNIKAEHSSQVDLLEASVSESITEKASLEVAEEHMKSLHEQLSRYRSQEQNFESRLMELKKQHAEDLLVLRGQIEAEKSAEVDKLKQDFSSKIRKLETNLDVQSKASSNEELVKSMQSKHQIEMVECETTLKSEQEVALQCLRSELENSHREEINRLNQQMINEAETLQSNFEKEMKEANEATRKQVTEEMESIRLAQIQKVQTEYEEQMSQLKRSIVQVEREAIAKSKKELEAYRVEITELKAEKMKWEPIRQDLLSQLELSQRHRQELEQSLVRMEAERKQLSEDCDRFQKKMKNLEVDLSISRSSEEHIQQILEQKQNALTAREEELSTSLTEVEEFKNEVEQLQEEGQTRDEEYQLFVDQMAAKNMAFANLQAENDSLKSSVDALAKAHQKDVEACEKLKAQLENSWGVNEELQVLKQQVLELEAYKESYGDMQIKVDSLEELIRSKDEDNSSLQEQVEQSSLAVTEANKRCSQFEEASSNTAKEAEVLRVEVARLVESERILKERLSQISEELKEVKSQLEDSSQAMAEAVSRGSHFEAANTDLSKEAELLRSEVARLSQSEVSLKADLERTNNELMEVKAKLKEADDRCEQKVIKIDEMEQMIEELKSKEASSGEQKLAEKDSTIEELNSRLAVILSKEEERNLELDMKNRAIRDMEARIASLESELSEKNQIIQELNQTVEDLETKLSLADGDITKLEEEKSRLQLDLLQSQNDSEVEGIDSGQQDLAEKYRNLQCEFEELGRERAQFIAEINELRNHSKSDETLKTKVKEQERIIKDLRSKLVFNESASFMPGSMAFQSTDFDFSRSPLETTLSRARQALTEKLQEKVAIEKELGIRRAKLERQQAEKQYLEELLFEKKRFEQELHNQKGQLQKELQDLEARLKLKAGQDKKTSAKHKPKVN